MKKSLFFAAAASALMLTACSSENDVVQSPTNQNTVAVQQQAVGFDIYTPSATNARRAGYEGVMTTPRLQKPTAGFGVFAYYQDGVDYSPSSLDPDFMYNQEVTWAGGWTYNPLKYWPNETNNDSQDPAATATPATNKLDKISFFAYAPYVNPTTAGTIGASTTALVFSPAETKGITGIFDNSLSSDPLVEWKYTDDPDENVDLLWGVAPAGFTYTNVSGNTTEVPVGMPLKNLVKPDKDQKVKFLFQHALSRIGLSVVSAIDQIAAGDDAGSFTKDPTTKVLIKSVTLTGKFGTEGVLNLNNTSSNVAKWDETTKDAGTAALFTINGATVDGETSSAAGNYFLASDLRYVATQISDVGTDAANFAAVNPGVLPSEQTLLAQVGDPDKVATDLTYAVGKKLYKQSGNDYVRATTTATAAADVFKKVSSNWIQVAKSTDPAITLNGDEEQYYTLVETSKTPAEVDAAPEGKYFTKSTDAVTGYVTYEKYTVSGATPAGTYYTLSATPLEVSAYTGTCYTGLQPRYFMVIPTGNTDITVNIKYAVVTKDTKLTGNVSNVENDITKKVTVNLENGKSYNLKLILGLTSVKLDATVADWKVADDTEIWLPQNNE